MNKNTKQMRSAKVKAEEEALNRILAWVAGGAALEFLLLLFNRYWCHYGPATLQLHLFLVELMPFLMAAAVLAAAAGGWQWRRAAKGKKNRWWPAVLCLMALGIAGGLFAAWFFGEAGILLMCFLTLAVVILAIIFLLYQREFFLLSCQAALAFLGLWICDRGLGGAKSIFCNIYVIGAAVLALAGAALLWKLQTGGGVLEWEEKKRRLLPKDVNYALLYGGTVVTLGVLICALLDLPTMVLCAVEVAWIFVMAVYYTVKLM